MAVDQPGSACALHRRFATLDLCAIISVFSVCTEIKDMQLSQVEQKFILHWGEMGTRWGINRTVAQIHALLLISEKPLHAEEIAKTLSVARSNVSSSLRELQGWGIVRVVHVLGDRRDHFESMRDVYEMFRVVSRERKRREIDPTLRVVRECVNDLKPTDNTSRHTRDRLAEMLAFLITSSELFDDLIDLPISTLKHASRIRATLKRLSGKGSRT